MPAGEDDEMYYCFSKREDPFGKLAPKNIKIKYVIKPDGIISREDVINGKWNTENVLNGYVDSCTVIFSGGLTIQPFAFAGVQNLKKVMFTNFDDTSTKIGEHAFDSCFNLEKIEGVDYAKLSFAECCFKNCRSLLPFKLPGVLQIRVNAFDGCSDECRLYMLRQISDPRYPKAVFWPILTSDVEPDKKQFLKTKLSEPYRTNRFRF